MYSLNQIFLIFFSIILLSSFNQKVTAPSYIDVSNYGVTGDGFTDNTVAIRNIFKNIDTTIATTVFFPEGTYLIDPSDSKSMEIVGSNTTVDGIKGHTVIKLKCNSIDPRIPLDKGHSVQRLLEGVLLGNKHRSKGYIIDQNITIRNIIFDANCRANLIADNYASSGANNAVHFYNVDGLKVENCEIINSCIAALVLLDCKNSIIQNNYIFDVGQGIRSGDGIQINSCSNTLIKNNILENTGEGIFCQHFNSTNDQDCRIENNIIRIVDYNGKCLGDQYPYSCCTGFRAGDSIGFGCRIGIAKGPSIGILSQNSYAKENLIFRHFPITVQSQEKHANVPTKNIKIYKNTLVETSKFNPSSGGAIGLFCDENILLSDIEVYENSIIDSYCSGIAIGYTTDSTLKTGLIKNINIYNNTIQRTCLGGLGKCASILFHNKSFETNIDRFVNIKIRNNYITDQDKFVIWLDKGARSLKFNKNTFRNYKPHYLFNLQCQSSLPCNRKAITQYKNNSPFILKEGERLIKVMSNNTTLSNYCLDCNNGKGCYVELKNGLMKCK